MSHGTNRISFHLLIHTHIWFEPSTFFSFERRWKKDSTSYTVQYEIGSGRLKTSAITSWSKWFVLPWCVSPLFFFSRLPLSVLLSYSGPERQRLASIIFFTWKYKARSSGLPHYLTGPWHQLPWRSLALIFFIFQLVMFFKWVFAQQHNMSRARIWPGQYHP